MTRPVRTVPILVGDVTLLAEVVNVGGTQNTSGLDRAQEVVTGAFGSAQQAIVAIARSTVATAQELTHQALSPEEVEVKFALKFSVDGGVILAGVSGEASLEVTLKYKRRGGQELADGHSSSNP